MKKLINFLLIISLILIPSIAIASGGDEPPPEEPAPTCGTIQGLEPKEFISDNVNFEYLKTNFSNRWPLDMVIVEPSTGDGSMDCPVFNLLGRSMPACVIVMVVKMAKWPMIIRYIIWSIFAI